MADEGLRLTTRGHMFKHVCSRILKSQNLGPDLGPDLGQTWFVPRLDKLSSVVCSSDGKAMAWKQQQFAHEATKAYCTSLPLTEGRPEKSASLCFRCTHLQSLAQQLHCLCKKNMPASDPEPLTTLTST